MGPIGLTGNLSRDLDKSYASVMPGDAAGYIPIIEARISYELEAAILQTLLALDPEHYRVSGNRLIADGCAYNVMVGYRDLLREDTVGVVVLEDEASGEFARTKISIVGTGKFTGGEIIVSSRLGEHIDTIAELSKAFYEVGYSWINEFLRAKTRQVEFSVVEELYRSVRIAFAGMPSIADHVWLVLIQGNHAAYLFDQHTYKQTIAAISVPRGRTRESPAALYLGLLGRTLLYEQTFSRHAVSSGEAIHCDLSKAEYASDETLVAIAEGVLFRSSAERSQVITLFPISRSDQPFLIAVFPSSEEDEILPVLRHNAAAMCTILNAKKNVARAVIEGIRSSSADHLPLGQAGELIGGFIRGLAGLG